MTQMGADQEGMPAAPQATKSSLHLRSSAVICAHLRMDHPILMGTAPGARKEDRLPNDMIQASWPSPDQPVKTPVQRY